MYQTTRLQITEDGHHEDSVEVVKGKNNHLRMVRMAVRRSSGR